MKDLKNWDGYSSKGQAAYDAVFEEEKRQEDLMYCICGCMKDDEDKYCDGDYCGMGMDME